jgi:hypothetical protein
MVNLPAPLTTQQAMGGTWSASGQLQQLSEDNPDLRWPNSTYVYDRMRKDGKCASVLRAASLPIRKTGWHVVDSPDVRPEVATFVRNELGLVEQGDTRRRRRGQGVSWDDVLRHALLMLPFGHMFFEPVYQLGQPGPNDTLPAGMQVAHLSRLAPILPRTITGFDLDDTGDLISIQQSASIQNGQYKTVTIPRALLLPVINDQEGSDWAGQSILRAAYKHWFMKDQLERLGLMIVERNGMGVPVAEYGPDHDRNQTLRALNAFRAGDMAGALFPQGANPQLLGVTGQTVDPMPQLAYHGQEIARSVLAMFLDLGHDNGARSLGETFVDFFTLAINAVIAHLEETFTEQLARSLVELNFGEDEAYPEIIADEITPQAPLTAEAIGTLLTAGAITADPSLEGFVRHTFGMPPVSPAEQEAAPAEVETVQDTIPVAAGKSSMSGETLDMRRTRLAMLRQRVGLRRRGR